MHREWSDSKTEQEPLNAPESIRPPKTLIELLETTSERLDPEVRTLFEVFANEYPQAHKIAFELFSPEDAFDAGGFYQINEFQDRLGPVIFVSEGQHEQLAPLMSIRRTSVEINARLLGIDPERMTTRLLHRFILAHEMGHALDFLKNYLPDFDDSYEAEEQMTSDRENSKATLPVPGISPTYLARELSSLHTLTEVVTQFPKLARHPDFSTLTSVADVLRLQEQAYRATPQEHYADAFAANFLISHAHELGFPELERETEPLQAKAA